MADTPRDAAMLVLIRDAIDAEATSEVLLVNRCSEAAGGVETYAFLGGTLDATDVIPSALALSRAFSADEAALRLGDVESASRALSFWIAALRHTFEQAGLLLARYGDGRLWTPDGADVERLGQQRQAILQGKTNFPNMMHDLERALATDLLIYFAHGIMPHTPSQHVATRFFLAGMPSGLTPLPDHHAGVAPLWVTPEAALQRHDDATWRLTTVTTTILHLLRPFPSASAAIEHLRRQAVPTALP